jgi:hydrogenase maturation protease
LSDDRLLVIAFGSPLRTDDGVALAALSELRRLGHKRPGVDLIDGGVKGINLLSVLEDYDRAIVLDAVLGEKDSVGEILEIGLEDARFHLRPRASLHNLDLGTTFELARALEMKLPQVEFVLMRVHDVGPAEELTSAAQEALPAMVAAAVRRIQAFTDGATRSEAAEVRDRGSKPR